MRFLLDENFPLRLLRELNARGIDGEHVISLGLRGVSDSELVAHLETDPELVLLAQDADFEDVQLTQGRVVISRVLQGLPIQTRVELWVRALQALVADHLPRASIVEITATGDLRVLRD